MPVRALDRLADLGAMARAIGAAYSGSPSRFYNVSARGTGDFPLCPVRILGEFALQWTGEGEAVAWIGATIGGWVGWWLGSFVGPMTGFLVSCVGSAVGLFYSRRMLDDLTR